MRILPLMLLCLLYFVVCAIAPAIYRGYPLSPLYHQLMGRGVFIKVTFKNVFAGFANHRPRFNIFGLKVSRNHERNIYHQNRIRGLGAASAVGGRVG